ncbi:mannosyl-3-phosphoglycerate synthase [Diplogelasinospora grovesii]|uniref:Mannosyl-3-phosphoglycerate synthase n=1 Tax=Diplogelasinospora grovesii TaxID=303347 RepID=A0AAN6MYD4_9PEZI|nr:mannosyl-3-phosphoglycerate synthase [Diplogelasinospora grovesii]
MRLSVPPKCHYFGKLRIMDVNRVVELDAGHYGQTTQDPEYPQTQAVLSQQLQDILRDMAIVVPCKNEPADILEGVLSGIPHDCLAILVSNSDQAQYEQELQTLAEFCHSAARSALAIHQKDVGAATAFAAAGMPDVFLTVDDNGCPTIRNGKGEGMLIGIALAAVMVPERRYIGFVDADNLVPGAVHEYCTSFAAGLALSAADQGGGQDTMVRISWPSKPKVRAGQVVFDRQGRSSHVVNGWLNRLLADISGLPAADLNIVTTGNAGEHAMSVSLGLKLRLAGGYAVEPFHYLDLLEQQLGSGHVDRVSIMQIGTRNPHFHRDKGDEHVRGMWAQALSVMYHSSATPTKLRGDILAFMVEQGRLGQGQEPPQHRIYPSIGSLDLARLDLILREQATSLQRFGPKAD